MSSYLEKPVIWTRCSATTFQDGEPCIYTDCSVKLDAELLVEYEDEGEIIQYRGPNPGSGHFILKSSQRNGTATLHFSPETLLMEGSWVEDGMSGMWKIYLKD